MASPKKKNHKTSPVIILVLALLIVIVGVQCVRVYRQLGTANEEASSLSQQVEDQTKENESLKDDLSKADDVDFIKSLARKLLGLVDSNEKVFYDVNN